MEHTLDYKSPPKYSSYQQRHTKAFGELPMLTREEFAELSRANCRYCGVAGPNGIDRIDSAKGYARGNCVSCCKHCNYAKGNLALDVFRVWARRFAAHQSRDPV